MEFGYVIGWVGVAFGLCVPIPQLIKMLKTRNLDGISLGTYVFLFLCLISYLFHAIYIKSPVFITAQSLNLISNGAILILLIRHRISNGKDKSARL